MKVLDSAGRELKVGMEAQEAKPYADTLKVVELDGPWIGTRHLNSGTWQRWWTSRISPNGTARRCPDLTAIHNTEE